MRRLKSLTALVVALSWLGGSAAALDKVSFGTDWKAQAEQGGFFQAKAAGIYAKHGLEVEIRSGGPQVNQNQLLILGRLDFNMSSNSFIVLNYVKEDIPMVAVAAMFQKDPAVLIAHPGQGHDSLAALRGKPIHIGGGTRVGHWEFLKARFGYTDDQIRTYTFNLAPFLSDTSMIQQGYLGSEPFTIEQNGIKPVVMLLADAGFDSYGALIQTSWKQANENPDLVRRFVAASIKGWESYLNGDPAPGHELIKRYNPEMSDDLLAYGRAKLKENGIVKSGDASTLGIGAMTEARWRAFHGMMAKQGLYPEDLDLSRAYTTEFFPEQ